MHLGNDSALISKHHTNWRLQALRSMDHETKDDLHYSSAITISHKDAVKIKAMLVDSLENIRKVVHPSFAEDLYIFNMDFFRF